MTKISAFAICFILFIFPYICQAEISKNVRLGVGSSVFTSFARPDGGGSFNLHVRYERFTPFELEMSYLIARGGIEIILLIDIIRSRYVNWHFFDFGLYFPLDTRPFSNINLERRFDIVVGTGLDIPLRRLPNFFITLNLRFFIPDPNRIGHYASARARSALNDVEERFTLDILEDLDAFIDEESEYVLDEFKNGFRDIFRDVGRSVIFMIGIKYYFN